MSTLADFKAHASSCSRCASVDLARTATLSSACREGAELLKCEIADARRTWRPAARWRYPRALRKGRRA